LFRADTAQRVGALALASLDRYAPRPEDLLGCVREEVPPDLAVAVHRAVRERLVQRPVDDYRIDFEDGFGPRSDDEEDREARRVSRELSQGMATGTLPRGIGVRVKSLEPATAERSLATLEAVVSTVARAAGALPEGFVVTLPKVRDPLEVSVLAEALERLERAHGLKPNALSLELMIETPEALVSHGTLAARSLVDAARGRCVAVHLGAFDLTARLGVGARDQDLGHPYCSLARALLALALAGTGCSVSDGATTRMPVAPHRGDALTQAQHRENTLVVHDAWRAHAHNVSRALSVGIDRGWDLHPGQLPARYAALFLHHREGFEALCKRLQGFLTQAARATRQGGAMDDAATGQGMLNAVLRAVDCGAVSHTEAEAAIGRSVERLRARDLAALLVP
jgi:citrate lyase beta subunit